MNTKLLLYLVSIILFAGCSSSKNAQKEIARSMTEGQQQTEADQRNNNIIRPGDEIEILVWQNESLNTKTYVSSQGIIAMPLLGEIKVNGLTKEQLNSELESRLRKYINGEINITISVTNTRDDLITVLGSVARPNNFPLVDRISVFELLSMAGGASADADLRNIKVYRRDHLPQHDKIDLTSYIDSGQLDPTVKVGPGDIVFVPREKNVIRELSGFLSDLVLVFGLFRAFN